MDCSLSLEYESINDRISRLRKQSSYTNNTARRHEREFEEPIRILKKTTYNIEIEKIIQESRQRVQRYSNKKVEIPEPALLNVLSPRKNVMSGNFTKNSRPVLTLQLSEKQNTLTSNRVSTPRTPGRICKNIPRIYSQNFDFLSLNGLRQTWSKQ